LIVLALYTLTFDHVSFIYLNV